MSDTDGQSVSRRGLLAGAAATVGSAAAAGPATAQEDGNETDGGDGGGDGGGGQTHEVDMEGTSFLPSELTIAPGDTVSWTTTGSQDHSVTAYEDEIPEGATYFASGGFDSEEAARQGYNNGEGHVGPDETYTHTFETLGTYGYFCIPHEGAQMVGTIEVVEGGGGGGGGFQSALTDSFKTLGVATVGAMVSVLALAFVFLKFGGVEDRSASRE